MSRSGTTGFFSSWDLLGIFIAMENTADSEREETGTTAHTHLQERVAQLEKGPSAVVEKKRKEIVPQLALVFSILVPHFSILAAQHFLSPVLAITLVVLVWFAGTNCFIYWYFPPPEKLIFDATRDKDADFDGKAGLQGKKEPRDENDEDTGTNKRARTNGITQEQCVAAHLLDWKRTESAKACFVGQSDPFVENPYCFTSLVTQVGAEATIVCSFGVHGEDEDSNHNMRVVRGLFNPPGGRATPINIVDFYPERCGSMSGTRNALEGIWWLYGWRGEKWMVEDNIPFFQDLSKVSRLVFCTGISKDPSFNVDFAYEQGWHIQNITNGSKVLNHARGLEFWVRLVMEISVDSPSHQAACERVVDTIVRECKDGVGERAVDAMADGSPFPSATADAQRIVALRHEKCPSSLVAFGAVGGAKPKGGHVDLKSPFNKPKALERLSFRRPFTEQTYQTFRTTQEKVIKAQQNRMGSTKALSMTVPPHVILPPGGNDEWAVTTTKGIDKVKMRTIHERLNEFPCPKCGKVLKSPQALKYHTTSPTACRS
jgi:hypothetical protein